VKIVVQREKQANSREQASPPVTMVVFIVQKNLAGIDAVVVAFVASSHRLGIHMTRKHNGTHKTGSA